MALKLTNSVFSAGFSLKKEHQLHIRQWTENLWIHMLCMQLALGPVFLGNLPLQIWNLNGLLQIWVGLEVVFLDQLGQRKCSWDALNDKSWGLGCENWHSMKFQAVHSNVNQVQWSPNLSWKAFEHVLAKKMYLITDFKVIRNLEFFSLNRYPQASKLLHSYRQVTLWARGFFLRSKMIQSRSKFIACRPSTRFTTKAHSFTHSPYSRLWVWFWMSTTNWFPPTLGLIDQFLSWKVSVEPDASEHSSFD